MNEQNLIPWNQQSNHREFCSKGGKRSGEVRKEQARIRRRDKMVKAILETFTDEDLEQLYEHVQPREMTYNQYFREYYGVVFSKKRGIIIKN